MPWARDTVYDALVDREGEHILKKERYVVLYPQQPFCAVLYASGSRYDAAPLALNPGRDSFRADVFDRLSPLIEYVRRDNKGPRRKSQNFDHYRVVDWDKFATALGLEQVASVRAVEKNSEALQVHRATSAGT